MPELEQHTYAVDPAGRPGCGGCGWAGERSALDAVRRAQYTTHVRDAAILAAAFTQAGMHPTDAAIASTGIARHVP